MARLIPAIDVSTIANGGERIVATELIRQLPRACLVYHSYPWLHLTRSDYSSKQYLQPGETDFIVVDPDHGLLVLEVKGGTIDYDPLTHEFFRVHDRGGREQIQNPFDQAARNLYAIRDMILAHDSMRGQNTLPFAHGYAVAFPHCVYSGPMPPDAEREIVFSANDVPDLANKVRRALEVWSRTTHARPIDERMRDAIQESLSPIFKLTPVLWRTVEDQEEKLKRLTTDQEMVLGMLAKQPRAAIEGVAGSGKTILAMAQAQRFARDGMRTLLVCYNRPLADWLSRQLPDKFRELISVHSFHSLCAQFCKQARIPFLPADKGSSFWEYEAPELLEQACQSLPPEDRFDAVVVDEGQDFSDLWWMVLEKVQRHDDGTAPLYVFYDPKQNLFVEHPTLPGNLAGPFVLPTNCRNTRKIAEYCGQIIHSQIDVHENAPTGVSPVHLVAASETETIKAARDQVQDWCLIDRGNMPWSKVAILTVTEPGEEWPARFGVVKLTRDFDAWRENKGILLSTCRRFKGLEADAIVLAGIPKPDTTKHFSTADFYVATSRAKHLLTVISRQPLPS